MTRLLVLLRLVIGPNLQQRFRTLVTLLGIAISVSLVAWNLRGFDVVRSQVRSAAEKQQGRFDAVMVPKDFRGARLDPALIEAISHDEAVAEADAAVKSRVRLIRPPEVQQRGPFGGTTVVGTAAAQPPQPLVQGRWLGSGENETVVGEQFSKQYQLSLGDTVVVAGMGGELTLTVVGVVPGAPAPVQGVRMMPPAHLGDLFVSAATAAKLNGYGDRPSMLCIVLHDPESAAEFAAAWQSRLAQATPEATMRLLKVTDDDPMGAPPGTMQQMLFANATVLAFLAALFIIFVTLSANVRERTRQFAILRALALSRSQLIAMVALEALLLAVAGWAVGLVLIKGFLITGRLLGGSVAAFRSNMFSPAPLGKQIVLVSLAAAVVGALAAAVLPAWQACRISPVDILGGQTERRQGRFPLAMILVGLVLIAVNPVIIVLARHSEAVRSGLAHLWGLGSRGFATPLAGSAAMIVGFVLIAPLAVLAAERLFAPLAAWALRLDRRFLRGQLSGNLRRTTGTTIALSVGLTLFITSLVWGYSMLVPFTPTEGLPRMLVAMLPAGLPDSAVADVQAARGIKAGECLPVAVEQPRLTAEMLASPAFAHIDPQQQHIIVMGVDPGRAFGGDRPLFRLDFVAGTPETAAGEMAAGRGCVVPDHFCTQTGLGLGDSFSVDVPNVPGRQVSYRIVGVASVPGWNWLTKFSETRRRAGRALAMIFVDYRQARADYALDRVSYFWANVESGTTAAQIQKELEPLARRHAGIQADVPEVGRAVIGSQYVKVTDREEVLTMLMRRANDVIWALTWLPLITLVISSLAVFNAVAASVRSRFWQFGVLRGVGLTGGQLLRLILAESILIGGAACVLSLTAGIALAWCGTRLCTLFFFFGGHTPPLVLPWSLTLGLLLALGLCLLAAAIPAIRAATSEPLKYIQGGRLAA